MKKFFQSLLLLSIFTSQPLIVSADVSGLVPCKDSAVFKKRLDGSVKKLSTRLENYEPGTPAYLALEQQLSDTKRCRGVQCPLGTRICHLIANVSFF